MVQILQHRRNTTAALSSERGSEGEIIIDTTKKTVVVMDGVTNGGTPLAKEADIPVKVSDLANDAGYITSAAIFSGDYNDLSNKPLIPINVSQLVNDADYANGSVIPTAVSQLTNDLDFANGSVIPTAVSQLTNDLDFANGSVIPTAVSQLTNDLNFANVSIVPTDISDLTDTTNLLTQNIFDQELNTSNNVTFASVIFSGNNKISAASSSNLALGPNDFNIEFGTPLQNWAKLQGADLVTVSAISEFRVELGDGSYWSFGPAGALEFPDTSIQTGAAIPLSALKTLVASANTYSEFQAAIAAL